MKLGILLWAMLGESSVAAMRSRSRSADGNKRDSRMLIKESKTTTTTNNELDDDDNLTSTNRTVKIKTNMKVKKKEDNDKDLAASQEAIALENLRITEDNLTVAEEEIRVKDSELSIREEEHSRKKKVLEELTLSNNVLFRENEAMAEHYNSKSASLTAREMHNNNLKLKYGLSELN
ncbi:hypothetical protein ENBRE01_2616 [Enteropsectra breve]|nr:hypothetical protein ENBRE01_2574 [Enteropsectra breve]KAI5152162.1 hypothetical protein ENBRE01_2616 [Enteropsectra breve]